MEKTSLVQVYGSQTAAYHHAFQVFLDHTDQKMNARRWLDRFVEGLPARQTLIDAGAGTGQTTSWLIDRFKTTVAIEPSPSLASEFRRTCPGARLLQEKILDAGPGVAADLVLCAHVLYYIDRSSWPAHLERMASWLTPGGALVVLLQNPETYCMRMLRHFLGERFELGPVAYQFRAQHGNHFDVECDLI